MRLSFLALLASITLHAAPPTVTDPRLTIELIAAEPNIVTPTGMAVDEQGRLWVIENHTHQRPPTYKGPETDRVRVFSDPDENGKYKKITTFADGFKNAMSIVLRPDGVVLVATRSEIIQLRDTKNKGEADERKVLVKLDSPGNYPHNGLAGFAFDGVGWMYFGLGENLGAPYKLIGSDGSSESGGGEGGSVYRCKADGSKLERIATGTWNTFHMAFDALGRLFAVDNDPDARGPCRLLHIVQGGDYGYRFRNGRKGLHPFTAWNGELPGTLPMVAGTAEAPSGILAYESNGLPKEYIGKLLVTSWGDHVVEAFTLEPKGASFTAKSSILVKGGEDFRPVAIVTGPDGSIYLSDWANKSYPVHGHGRIWRVRMKEPAKVEAVKPKAVEAKLAVVPPGQPLEKMIPLLASEDPFVVSAALDALGRPGNGEFLVKHVESKDPKVRVGIAIALRRTGDKAALELLPRFLADSDPGVRRFGIQWVGEEKLKQYRVAIETAAAKEPVTKELFEALLASQDLLSNTFKPNLEAAGEGYVAKIVADENKPAVFRTFAMRMLRPDHPAITPELLGKWLKSSEKGLPQEALRTLAMRTDEPCQQMLRELAKDEKLDLEVRKMAIMGLAASSNSAETRQILTAALQDSKLRRDALRSLRDVAFDEKGRLEILRWYESFDKDRQLLGGERIEIYEQMRQLFNSWKDFNPKYTQVLIDSTNTGREPETLDEWKSALGQTGDAAGGERIYFHIRGANCAACHRIDGRGGQVGPDLSMIGASHDRAKLIESILAPSKEIAPMFTNWQFTMADGKTHTGIIVGEGFDSTITLADATGKLIKLKKLDIEERRPSPKSLMPDDLHRKMTVQEFRDLLEYLGKRKP